MSFLWNKSYSWVVDFAHSFSLPVLKSFNSWHFMVILPWGMTLDTRVKSSDLIFLWVCLIALKLRDFFFFFCQIECFTIFFSIYLISFWFKQFSYPWSHPKAVSLMIWQSSSSLLMRFVLCWKTMRCWNNLSFILDKQVWCDSLVRWISALEQNSVRIPMNLVKSNQQNR